MTDGHGDVQLVLSLSGGVSVPGPAAHRQGGDVRCRQCGRPLDLPAWVRQTGLRLHYCGPACRREWVSAAPDLAVRLCAASARPGRGGNWDLQARRARERDQFTCQVCGVTEEEIGQRLHVHHKIPYRRFRSNVEANKLEHLVSVCPSCHLKQEAQLRRRLPLFASP